MENATKALEMAAGVLIALMIIGLCVYAFNNLSEQKSVEQSVISEQQAADFNKSYEVYNKSGLYGSEVLSLANKITDYNESEAEEGYGTIDIEVNLTNTLEAFPRSSYNAENLYNDYMDLTNEIANTKSKKVTSSSGETKTIAEWAKLSASAIPSDIYNQISEYKNLLQDQTDFARKTFDCTDIEYDKNNGRILSMTFKETGS